MAKAENQLRCGFPDAPRNLAMTTILKKVYQRLFDALGPQHWWPGDSPFEVMVGAVLVQNTNWQNVKKAIDNLQQADLLDPHALYEVPTDELEELIRPSGYFRIKARRLHNLLEFFVGRYDGSIEAMFGTDLASLREELLGVGGIGPETADSILLYAGGLAVFVIDTYTHRVLARHGWIGFDADYHAIQDYFQGSLPEDPALYNEYHALLVRLGKDYCRKSSPRCEQCPLAELLPDGGPLEPDD
ncbi:MAG: endonuclease III domain-containing protein [Planctomycetota bacterium]